MASRVFRLEPTKGFQRLVPDYPSGAPELAVLRVLRGISQADRWRSLRFYVLEPRLQRPDIWFFSSAPAIAVTKGTRNLLGSALSKTSELLPITVDGEDQLLVNVLVDFNCLDSAVSELDELEGQRYVFIEHRLPESGLFKIPESDYLEILLLERDDDTEPIFRQAVERNSLSGVHFRLLWGSDQPPIDLHDDADAWF